MSGQGLVKAKNMVAMILSLVALSGSIGGYYVLQYRVTVLEMEADKTDELREKVQSLVTQVTLLLDRDSRVPGGPGHTLTPLTTPVSPPPVEKQVDDLLDRLRRHKQRTDDSEDKKPAEKKAPAKKPEENPDASRQTSPSIDVRQRRRARNNRASAVAVEGRDRDGCGNGSTHRAFHGCNRFVPDRSRLQEAWRETSWGSRGISRQRGERGHARGHG